MEEKDHQNFDLEDIIKEFSNLPEAEQEEILPEEAEQILAETVQEQTEEAPQEVLEATPAEESPEAAAVPAEEAPEEQEIPAGVTGDTVRFDTIRLDTESLPKGKVRNAEPIRDEEEVPATQKEPFSSGWEPEYEQPMGEYIPPQPIVFHPRSRLRELKRKLVAGPEKRYYTLSEKGLGKLQAAIFISLLVVLICAGATVMYTLGAVQENRMRLMIFGQFLAMLVSALLGSFQMIDGIADLFRKRFTLNTMLAFTFLVCCADGVLCLRQLRVPCCAAFSLEVTMSLWSAYQRRSAEMGQMDTMRKANHLDGVGLVEDYHAGRKGLLRGEGQVEDFMDHYDVPSGPEKVLSVYAFAAFLLSIGIGVTAGVLHGLSTGIQVCAVSMLAAVPATAFITTSRPFAILERRLHNLGTVLCGWRGVKGLCGKAYFPLTYEDLFPAGSVRLNGVKFYGNRQTDAVVAYTTALITASGSGLAPLFTQVLESRNGRYCDAVNLRAYENGGIGAEVEDLPVLVGSLSFLKEMGVEVPEGIRVSNALCVAIDGEFSGLFAVTYDKVRSASAGLTTLCAYRGLKPMLINGDFTLTDSFIRKKFSVNPKRMLFPEQAVRETLKARELEPAAQALLLVTTEGLAPFAYGVTGARALRTASILGVTVHMIGGVLGLLVMGGLTALGALELLTPANMFLYQLVWMLPGLLITEWTRSI